MPDFLGAQIVNADDHPVRRGFQTITGRW
jgi:hypothetical protein